jgi:hypothetical protein
MEVLEKESSNRIAVLIGTLHTRAAELARHYRILRQDFFLERQLS